MLIRIALYSVLFYIIYTLIIYVRMCVYMNIYIYIYLSTLSHCCHIENVHYVAHPSLVCTKEPHWCKVSMRFLLRKRDRFWVHVPDVPFGRKNQIMIGHSKEKT